MKEFCLNTHFCITTGKLPIGKFSGSITITKPSKFISAQGDVDINELNVCGFDISGTAKEIMKKAKANLAAVIAKAELESDPSYIHDNEVYRNRILELQNI